MRAHPFVFNLRRCEGAMRCVRACPVQALRFRLGAPRRIDARCIGCGECYQACRYRAIEIATDFVAALAEYRYRVAVPSPVLFGQFGPEFTPAQVLAALKQVGFDEVYDVLPVCESVARAVQRYVREHRGPRPVIVTSCPTILRLIQIRYPVLTELVAPLKSPREIAAEDLKARAAAGGREKLGAIYVTPCAAKMMAIAEPPEGRASRLDSAVAISDLYGALLTALTRDRKANSVVVPDDAGHPGVLWALGDGLGHFIDAEQRIPVSGIPGVMKVLDDIEGGRLRAVEVVECFSCPGGCVAGPLTVANPYLARQRILKLAEKAPRRPPQSDETFQRLYDEGRFLLPEHLLPRPVEALDGNLAAAIEKIKFKEQLYRKLPKLDCGLCGAPTCEVFARDVAQREAVLDDCVFYSADRLDELRRRYLATHLDQTKPPTTEPGR